MERTEKQLKELAAYLQEASRISLAETQQLLGVSESTARRLFSKMQSEGNAIRVHGGLQSIPVQGRQEYNYPSMEALRLPQKKRIARAAIAEIDDARTLFLDSGSTVYQFSVCLAEWLRAGKRNPVSVFTNSFKNLQALTGLANIQFIGGQYRENRQDCCGYLAEMALQSLNFDLCVLGADGCNPEGGVSCTDMETARLGQIAVKHSRKRVVLVDASKFRKDALITYARMEEINGIITDCELDDETAAFVQQKGPSLRRV